MTTVATRPTMAKKKSEDAPSTLSVKLHMDVIEAARIVSAYRNETITDLLSNALRPILAKMEKAEVEKRGREAGSK